MFKAITLAAALTLTEAARTKQHDPEHPDIDEKCKEPNLSGTWTWHGGEKNGNDVVLDIYNEMVEGETGNAHWTFVCTLRYEDEVTNEVYIFHEIMDGVNVEKLE